MNTKFFECVPNISEGRDFVVIEQIAKTISGVAGVKLLHVDSNPDANRTVYTFIGSENSIIEAVYLIYKEAFNLIDMAQHKGVHPRIGAVDVCPIIPFKNSNIDDAKDLVRRVSVKIEKELNLPLVYYAESAQSEENALLANIRKGEYENIKQRIENHELSLDSGNLDNLSRFGVGAIGARDFLVAFNVNLKSKDIKTARRIASLVREKKSGFVGLRAIAWEMYEYDNVQISCNITNYKSTPIHLVFDLIRDTSAKFGIELNGSELIGLIPEDALLISADALFGNLEIAKEDKIKKLSVYLGLDSINEFEPEKRILDYLIAA